MALPSELNGRQTGPVAEGANETFLVLKPGRLRHLFDRAGTKCTSTKMHSSTARPITLVTSHPLASTNPAAMPKLCRISQELGRNLCHCQGVGRAQTPALKGRDDGMDKRNRREGGGM